MEIRAIGEEVSLEGATVVVGVLAKGSPIPGTEELVDSIDPGLLAANRFEGKAGQLLVALHQQAAAVLLVGLGEEVSFESLRAAAGNAVRRIKTSRGVSYLGKVSVAGATRAVVEGAVLGAYRYTEYKTANDENGKIEDLEIVGADESEVIEALAGAQATNLARDWVNTPAKDQSPAALAEGISIAAIRTGISVEIWDEQRIADEELGGVIGVAAGSDRPPRVVILRHGPSESVGHLGLVGKGITFDTGGLSIKPAKSMETMKTDMSGGAAVASATIAVAKLGLPVTVTAVIPITDNAVGGDATRPGDVLRPVDGPTIEVLNTDAEGRLILADGLGVIRRYDCDLIVDVATPDRLRGGCAGKRNSSRVRFGPGRLGPRPEGGITRRGVFLGAAAVRALPEAIGVGYRRHQEHLGRSVRGGHNGGVVSFSLCGRRALGPYRHCRTRKVEEDRRRRSERCFRRGGSNPHRDRPGDSRFWLEPAKSRSILDDANQIPGFCGGNRLDRPRDLLCRCVLVGLRHVPSVGIRRRQRRGAHDGVSGGLHVGDVLSHRTDVRTWRSQAGVRPDVHHLPWLRCFHCQLSRAVS